MKNKNSISIHDQALMQTLLGNKLYYTITMVCAYVTIYQITASTLQKSTATTSQLIFQVKKLLSKFCRSQLERISFLDCEGIKRLGIHSFYFFKLTQLGFGIQKEHESGFEPSSVTLCELWLELPRVFLALPTVSSRELSFSKPRSETAKLI